MQWVQFEAHPTSACIALVQSEWLHAMQVAYTAGSHVCIAPVETVAKPLKFLAVDAAAAHAGALVLAVDWCRIHGTLITASEDCRCASMPHAYAALWHCTPSCHGRSAYARRACFVGLHKPWYESLQRCCRSFRQPVAMIQMGQGLNAAAANIRQSTQQSAPSVCSSHRLLQQAS